LRKDLNVLSDLRVFSYRPSVALKKRFPRNKPFTQWNRIGEQKMVPSGLNVPEGSPAAKTLRHKGDGISHNLFGATPINPPMGYLFLLFSLLRWYIQKTYGNWRPHKPPGAVRAGFHAEMALFRNLSPSLWATAKQAGAMRPMCRRINPPEERRAILRDCLFPCLGEANDLDWPCEKSLISELETDAGGFPNPSVPNGHKVWGLGNFDFKVVKEMDV